MSSSARKMFAAVAAGATVLAGLALAPSASADQGNRSTYLVQTARGVSNAAAEQALTAAGGTVTARWTAALQGFAVELPDAAVAGLSRNPSIGGIEPDGVAYAVDLSWGLDRLDEVALPLDGAYRHDTDGTGVDVYVIDTGIYADHLEYLGRVGTSRNFVAKGRSVDPNDWNDCNGHGTHVAGTIGGASTGVAPGVTLHAARVLNCQGSGTWSGVIDGIDWVASEAVSKNKTVVANMSLGGSKSDTINAAVEGAVSKGVVMAVAAGNESTDACTKSPASAGSAITVGATTSSDAQASYSNFGTCVDIYAPGSGIYSSWNDGLYKTISGTSMATPHVAGSAARYVGANGNPSPQQVATALGAGALTGKVTSIGSGSPNTLLNTCFMDTVDCRGTSSSTLTVTTSSLPGGSVGVDYSATLVASGGSGALSWAVTGGALPAGLTLNSDGTITGKPTTVETSSFTATVTDSATPPKTASSSGLNIVVTSPSQATAPDAPGNVRVSTRKGLTKVTWDLPASDGGSPITMFEVRFTGGDWIDVGLTTSANFRGLSKGTTYVADVRAWNIAGPGAFASSDPFVAGS